jgi:dolichyl-phosphate beta-glucosyltransferase
VDGSRTLVVPCYNEAGRLDAERWLRLAGHSNIKLLFVDDGSRDETRKVLEALRDRSEGTADVLALPRNVGKGEAVRAGLRRAIDMGATEVGYSDADFATPPDEIARLFDALAQSPKLVGIIGSRINYLGTRIRRRALRHYLGRVFATGAATALGREVYDTQCGAKVFRVGPPLERALREPFFSRWAFDVELLARLFEGTDNAHDVVEEMPLRSWVHVSGSKLSAGGMMKASLDLAKIAWRYRIANKR